MKIFRCTYKPSKRFLPQRSFYKLKAIVNRMNTESGFINEKSNRYHLLGALELKEYNKPVGYLQTKISDRYMLTFKNSEMEIDKSSGKILKCKKNVLTPWNKVLKKAAAFIIELDKNYHNPDTVNKKTINIFAFPKEAIEKLQQTRRNI